jgi:hypothetical protein
MNCVSSKLADTYRNVEYIADPMSLLEDQYATTPMAAVQPAFRQSGEEEVYTSFEQAISDRVMAVNRQLSCLSGPITDSGYVQPHTDELVEQDIAAITALLPDAANSSHHESVWQRTLLMVCLCLMLVMLGFDLMGVLLVYGGR